MCRHSVQELRVPITSCTAGAAAAKAEKKKRDLYALLPNQYQFVPFAVELSAHSETMHTNLSANWAVGFVPPRANCGKRPGSYSESASQTSEAMQPACCQLSPQTPSPNLRSNHNTHSINNTPIPFQSLSQCGG